MTSKREVQLKKIFPEVNEKLIKDYKCSLYLDFHHPGRLFITQNHLYFYSTKNIEPPLPNPLAVTSDFSELKSIEKSGMDGIIIIKGSEEILLDSFQFRNETFDVLQRHFLLSKGKNPGAPSSAEKKEYQPLDIEVQNLMQTSIDGLPFLNDIGLLSKHYKVDDKDKVVFLGSDTENMNRYERLKHLLITLGSLVDPSFDKEKISTAFDIYFENAESEKVKYSLEPPTVIQFLKDNLSEHHPLVIVLKACIHPITAAILRLKDSLTSFYPTKDRSWQVDVVVNDDNVNVSHVRHEQALDESFQVQWKMHLVFSRDMKSLRKVSHFVTDLQFHPETKEPIRYEIQQLLKDFLPPAAWGAPSSVVLPSFVDLSNQKLTSIPPEVFELKGLQTLYLHANELEALPEELKQLENLQVLYLNQNKLKVFPQVILSLPALQELHLGRNGLEELPKEIGTVTSLRELSLSYNALKTLPTELFQLKNMRKLYVHNNYLEDVASELATLPNIKTLQLHNNQKMGPPLSNFGPHDSEEIIAHLKSRIP